MRSVKCLFIILILLSFKISAQELTCADFKKSTFIIPTDEEIKMYRININDSIVKEVSYPKNSLVKRYIIERKNETQIEWENGINNGEPEFIKLEWIDDCTYRLTYDDSKKAINKRQQWANENNGIIVSKIKIEGQCMFYDATMTTLAGEKISQEGVICLYNDKE
ncbi:hypothetical protein [Croceibacter atlanticus]|uniref:hypothetical protein n=1 Tax=Croceibacter atlanticus TaxID=313588 RepID=UPI0030F88963